MSGPFISQVAESIPFDNSSNGFAAENVQAAIEEVNVSGINFSYNYVAGPLTIPLYQQMLVYQELEIGPLGELNLLGELAILE